MQPDFLSVYCFVICFICLPLQSFCNIVVSQHSQENASARASFLNSLQLQAILIKKGAPALVFFWQLKFLITAFLNLIRFEKKPCYKKRGSDTYQKSNYAMNFDKISVFWQWVIQILIIWKNY